MRYKAALTDFCGVQKFFELVMTYITYTTRLGLGLEGREARIVAQLVNAGAERQQRPRRAAVP